VSETLVFVLGVSYLASLAIVTFIIARATRKEIGEEEAARQRDEHQDR
jgi:hypothetical protein